MKFMRIGEAGQERPCVVDAHGVVRDISGLVPDIGPDSAEGLIARLAGADLSSLPDVVPEGARIGPPMLRPHNIFCIGLNYSDHAAEAGMALPQEPILFNKATGAFCGPQDPLLYAPNMSKLDWEVELGVVIGKPALRVAPEDALAHVLGFTLVNDISERSWQTERGGQWVKGKSFVNFCPTGPWLVTPDTLGDHTALDLWLDVNGTRMQAGNTAKMVFDVATIISHLSHFLRLEAGDLICTGTPPGVGMGQRPPVFLRPGDVLRFGIAGLGEQRHEVILP